MIKVKIKKSSLIWDEWNTKHIEKHNVNSKEVEMAIDNDYVARETNKNRIMIIGKSNTRMLSIILNKETRGYYVVTARDASKVERRIYKDEKD